MLRLFMVFCVSVAAASNVCALPPSEALEAFDDGRALLQENKYAGAVAAFNRALEMTPGDAAMRVMIGMQLLRQKPPQMKRSAYELFRVASRIDQNNFIANRVLGDWYYNRFFFRESTVRYRRALKSRPDDPDTLNNLALSLDGLKRFKEAKETAERAIACAKEKGRYLVGLAWIYVGWRKPEKALEVLKKTDPQKLKGYDRDLFFRKRAEAYMLSGMKENAVADLRKLTTISPRYAKGFQLLGLYLQKLERYEEAEKAFRKAIALDPDMEEAHYGIGIVCMKLKRRAEGKKQLKRFNELAKKRQEKRLRDLEEMSAELGERQKRGWISGMGRS